MPPGQLLGVSGTCLQLEAPWAAGDVSSLPCSAKLQAAVVVNPGYSTLPPVFSLCLNWKGERNSSNDDNIRVTRGAGR